MNNFLLFLFLMLSGCNLAFAQVTVQHDELPNTDSADSKASLNNQLRQSQNAINSIGAYFNSNQYLTEANGGTGANLSAFQNGSILVQNTGNVGIGTFGQGTSGQYLQSQGLAVNPAWVTLTIPPVISNVLFQFSANTTLTGTGNGEIIGTTYVPTTATGNYRFLSSRDAGSSAYVTVWGTKWIKTAGVSTITVYGEIWINAGANSALLKVDVGGQNSTVTGTAAQSTPEWKSLTIDVSGLTNNTAYNVTVQLAHNEVATRNALLGNLIAFGS